MCRASATSSVLRPIAVFGQHPVRLLRRHPDRGLVDAVDGLLSDEPRRVAMGAAARSRAEEHFAWPDIARRLEVIYERVAGAAASPTREVVAA